MPRTLQTLKCLQNGSALGNETNRIACQAKAYKSIRFLNLRPTRFRREHFLLEVSQKGHQRLDTYVVGFFAKEIDHPLLERTMLFLDARRVASGVDSQCVLDSIPKQIRLDSGGLLLPLWH